MPLAPHAVHLGLWRTAIQYGTCKEAELDLSLADAGPRSRMPDAGQWAGRRFTGLGVELGSRIR